MARQALAGTGAQPVEGDGDEPRADVALLRGVDGVRGAPAELLDQPGDVHRGDLGSQASITVSAGDDFREACHAPAGGGPHLGGRIDLPGDRGQRSGTHLNAGPDVIGETGPWVVGSKRLVWACVEMRSGALASIAGQ